MSPPLARLSLYGRALTWRAQLYASGRLASQALPRPCVSVGNLTLGGTGKTPFVEFLARRLRFEGRRPAILSRGYGRRTRGLVVVCAGDGPIVSSDEGGDEPVALARALTGVLVIVAERRAEAAVKAAELGADVLVLDDGFQHLAVRRDVDLLLLDARDPFGGGRFPPLGRLREPVAALCRADAIVFTRVNRGAPPREALDEIARLHPRAPLFHARLRAGSVRDESGASIEPALLRTRRALAVSGIADGRDFAATLQELGLAPEETLAFRDHQRYGPRQLAAIGAAAARTGASWVLTTEKDAVKLSGRVGLPLLTVRLSVEVEEPDFFPFLTSRLAAAGVPAAP